MSGDFDYILKRKPVVRCPICMVEQRYVRARWRITELPLCTVHGCWLKDDLVEPAVTGYYSQPGRLRLAEVTSVAWMSFSLPFDCHMRRQNGPWISDDH
jgi:hypothetical protein